jgi:acetolactate synthase-1/2/3 large subunit
MKNGMPNFAGVAKAYNIKGYSVDDFKKLKKLILKFSKNNEPILLDVNVMEKENCYPMVVPGRSTSHMLGLEKSEKSEEF